MLTQDPVAQERPQARSSEAAPVALANIGLSFRTPGGELRPVLEDFSLRLASNECVALIGPSGCGKTTLIRVAAGLIAPDRGEVTILGLSPAEARRRKAIGLVFQAPALLPWRSAAANVRLALQINRAAGPMGDRTDELLERVGLSGFEHHLPHQLSGGMQQRVAVARALVTEPRLLLMDEPFSALDELTRAILQRDFLRLREEAAPAVLLVTHSVEEAVLMADRVVVLTKGPARVRGEVPIDLGWPRSVNPDLLEETETRSRIAEVRRLLKSVL